MEQKVFDSMLKSGEFEQMFNENKINELLSVGNLSKKQIDKLVELGKKLSKSELKKRQLELSKQPGYKEHILVPLIQKILAEQGRSRDPETGRYVRKAEQPPEEQKQEEEDPEDSGDEQDTAEEPEDNKETKTGGLGNRFKKIAKKFIPQKMKNMFLGPKSNTSQTINSKVNTELYTKVGSSKRPKLRKGDGAGTVGAKIYSILRNDIEEKKLTKELKNNFRESKVDNGKRRHDEIMEALGHSSGGKTEKTGKSDEEVASSGAGELITMLGLGAAAAGAIGAVGVASMKTSSSPASSAAAAQISTKKRQYSEDLQSPPVPLGGDKTSTASTSPSAAGPEEIIGQHNRLSKNVESTTPAEPAPAEPAPAEQAPAEQAPAEQAPAEQAPAEQAPAVSATQSSVSKTFVGPGFSTSEGTRWSYVLAGADPSTYTFSANTGQKKSDLDWGPNSIGKNGAAATAMAKEKNNASKLPDLVAVFDMQSKNQKLVSQADIEREKGRYIRIKPAAAASAKSNVATAPTTAAAVVGTAAAAKPVPVANATATPLPAEAAAEAAAAVPAKDTSSEMIIENQASTTAAKKPTAKKEPKAKPKTRQHYTGDMFAKDINGHFVNMTEEVYGLYKEYFDKTGKEIPFTSNIRTEAEQQDERNKGRYNDKKGRWETSAGRPIADYSEHFMGAAIDVSTKLTPDMRKFLKENGWYQPLPVDDDVHWVKNPNFKPEEKKPVLVTPALPALPASAPKKISYNTLDITPTLLASNDSDNSSTLSSNDVMTGLRLNQISSLNMDQKKRNTMQPIVLVNNTTTIIGSTKKETTSIPTDPDYNAYSPYAA